MSAQDIRTKRLIFSPAPHIHSGASISGTMMTFIIALLPALIFGISSYGMHAARVIAVAVGGAMASEWLIQRLFKRPVTVSDGSAALTGLLLALLLPPSVPWWLVLVGSFVSILIGKQIFGGTGGNPFNPVLIGWAAMRISWYDYINFDIAMVGYDVPFSIEYPLSVLKWSGAKAAQFPLVDLLMGKQIGGIGSVAVLLLLIGGLFLILRGVISWRIPVFFLIGTALAASLFWLVDSARYANPLFHLLTGNVVIGAFFLATDHSSSPVNGLAMILFGLGCGIFTILFRVWSIYPDVVVFAILIMNILNPLLDKIRPQVPGKEEKEAA
jgi:electron transport complex protein RnfD